MPKTGKFIRDGSTLVVFGAKGWREMGSKFQWSEVCFWGDENVPILTVGMVL